MCRVRESLARRPGSARADPAQGPSPPRWAYTYCTANFPLAGATVEAEPLGLPRTGRASNRKSGASAQTMVRGDGTRRHPHQTVGDAGAGSGDSGRSALTAGTSLSVPLIVVASAARRRRGRRRTRPVANLRSRSNATAKSLVSFGVRGGSRGPAMPRAAS